jgi:PAS domain S-box-containing protein
MSKTTVLIVEDEAIIAADLAGKLEQLGYEIIGTAAEGEEAIMLACRFRPQVILMDIWLKGPMDGIEAAAAIRRQLDAPVIYLTAHSDTATLARAKLTDPFGYILKPFEERELTTQLEMALYKHQVERQLRQQREWLRVTLNSIGDAVIACDAARHVTFINPVAASFTGWAANEALGQPVERVVRLLDEQTGQPGEDLVAQVLREHRVLELSNRITLVTKDGRHVPVEDIAAPMLDSEGNVAGVVVVFRDVTGKRLAEDALLESERRYRELVELSPDAILVERDDCFVFANRAAAKLFGATSPDELLGLNILDSTFAEDRSAIAERLWRLEERVYPDLPQHECRILRLDGEAIEVEVKAVPITFRSQPAIEVIYRDVSERRRAQRELNRLLGELRRKHAEVTGLLQGARAVAAHDKFEPALRSIFEACKALLKARAGYVALLGKTGMEHDLAFLDVDSALRPVEVSLPMPLGELWAAACRTQRPVYENAFPAGAHAGLIPEGHMTHQNVVLAPVLLKGQVVGLLGLANKPGGFTEEDVRMASAFADLVAVAFDNNRNLELLKDSEARFRLVTHSAVDAIVTADSDGTIVLWNRAAEELFGYAAGEIVGQPLLRLVPERLRASHERAFTRATKAGQLEVERRARETVGLKSDGTEVPVELSMAMWRRGADAFCTAIVRDITERKQHQQARQEAHHELELGVQQRTRDLQDAVTKLETEISARIRIEAEFRESEERYRTLFAAAPVGIVITDPSGRVHDANAAACAMFRVTLPEAQVSGASAFYAKPSDRRRLLERIRRESRVEEFETQLRRKDGTQFPAAVHVNWIQVHNDQWFLNIISDLTKRHQADRHIHGVAALQELFITKTVRDEYLKAVLHLLRKWCGCACAGIRLLDDKGHLPFVASVGFTRAFLKEEGELSIATGPCPCLQALNVRLGDREASSAWTRSSILSNTLPNHLEPSVTRPQAVQMCPCLKAGYSSVAQASIHFQGQFIGAIQLADRAGCKFAPETMNFLESAAPLVGEALHRFHIESELRESEERFRSMFERHHAVMLLIDPEFGKIIDANESAARFYGYPRAELRARSLQELSLEPMDAHRQPHRGGNSPSGGMACFPHCLAGGEIRTVEVHWSPIQMRDRTLHFCIIHDITDRRRLERQVLDIGDRERQRIGRDLHDSLGGSLSGLALVGKALSQMLAPSSSPEAVIAEELVDGINDAVGRVRSIARGLCPVGLSAFGFIIGLEELARNVEKRHRVRCHVRAPRELEIEEELVASHLFLIVEEAVNNAIRHGQAKELEIVVDWQQAKWSVTVRDDGVGLPEDIDRSPGMGLRTMRYRADVIGATLDLKSPPQGGTIISCVLSPGRSARGAPDLARA